MDDRTWKLTSRLAGLLAGLLLATASRADSVVPFAARAGLALASTAAQAWTSDAALVYIENDDELLAGATSVRWGYLFYSPSLERARVWSVRDGHIAAAENLDMRFDAPPVAPEWIDSDRALAAAEDGGGGAFRKEFGGKLVTMLLMRGAFSEGDPDVTTWTFVYSAPGAPSLFVVVDAADGKVQRTWRG